MWPADRAGPPRFRGSQSFGIKLASVHESVLCHHHRGRVEASTVPIEQDALEFSAPRGSKSAVEAAATVLTSRLPADQALGLRLLALARAAAAVHMAEGALPMLAGSQAAGLIREVAA